MKRSITVATTLLLAACQDQAPSTPAAPSPEISRTGPHEAPAPAEAMPELPLLDAFDQDRAYVATIGEGTITAIDPREHTVLWTLAVSEATPERKAESAMGIAATPDGRRVFTGDVARNQVVVVDADKRRIERRIDVPHGIHAVDIDPAGEVVWVGGRLEEYPWLSALTRIDATTLEAGPTISPALGNVAHLAFTPDGDEVWAVSVSTNLAWVMDADTGEVTDLLPLVAGPLESASPEGKMGLVGLNEVAIAPDGQRAFIVGPESGTLFAVDVATHEVVDRVKVGERTHGVAVTRDGAEVWTANNTGTVSIVDAQSLRVVDTVDMSHLVGDLTFAHVAFSLDGSEAWLSWRDSLAVIDVATRQVVQTLDVGAAPHENSLEDFYVQATAIQRQPAERLQVATTKGARKSSQAAGITVSATPTTPDPWTARTWTFELGLDTHMGDLMEEDIAQQIEVRLDGEPVEASLRWAPTSETSHHRAGALTVELPRPPKDSISLVIRDVGVPERTLTWRQTTTTAKR